MANFDFCLYGHDTKEEVSIGYGPQVMRQWSLEKFPGPYFFTDWLGLPERKLIFLPPDILQLLYARFRAANPSGVSIAEISELEGRFAPDLTVSQCDELYDQRKLFVGIADTDAAQGYPHLRRYMPELFDLQQLEVLATDPWLDAELLAKVAPTLRPDGEAGGVSEQGYRIISPQGRSERWWPQWRAYCDALRGHQSADSAPSAP